MVKPDNERRVLAALAARRGQAGSGHKNALLAELCGVETRADKAKARKLMTGLRDFLNDPRGFDWVMRQWNDHGDFQQLSFSKSIFQEGKITALVIGIEEIIPRIPRDYLDVGFLLVAEGKRGTVNRVYFGTKREVYYPLIASAAVARRGIDLGDGKWQERAKTEALKKAKKDFPKVSELPENYRVVIFNVQTPFCQNPFGCLVVMHLSPEFLAEKLGLAESQELFDFFRKAGS